MAAIIQPQIDCSSAQEFLDVLSPLGPHFGEFNLFDGWLFRGQGLDAPLVPSAFRSDGSLASITRRDITKYDERLLAERDILIQFFDIADRRGLVLPDDSQQLRSLLETLKSDRGDYLLARGNAGWIMPDLALSLLALAQHYGIPTRLLDWTRQPFIAAFFAAESAWEYSRNHEPSGPFVVWAFYFPALGKHDIVSRADDPIRIVTPPSATNANLKAQQGIFTLLHPHYTGEAQGQYQPMEQFLEEKAKNANPEASDSDKLVVACKLQKFTL